MIARALGQFRSRPVVGKSVLVLVSTAVSRGMIVLTTLILSHIVPSDELGQILYFLMTSLAGSILVASGCTTAVLRYVGMLLPRRTRLSAAAFVTGLGFALGISLIVGFLLIVVAPFLLPSARAIAGPGTYALLAATIAAQGLTMVAFSCLAAIGDFRTQSIWMIATTLAQNLLLILTAHFLGVAGAVIGYVVIGWLTLIVVVAALVRHAPRAGVILNLSVLRAAFRRRAFMRDMLRFAGLSSLAAALFEPVNWFCLSLLLSTSGGPSQVALFLAANQWFAIILFVPINLTQVTLPLVSRDYLQSGIILGQTAKRMLWICLAATGIVGTILFVAVPLLLQLYSRSIQVGADVFRIIAVTGIVVAIQVATGQILAAAGRVRASLSLNALWSLTYVGLTLLLLHRGAEGLAAGRLIAYCLHAAVTLFYIVGIGAHRNGAPALSKS